MDDAERRIVPTTMPLWRQIVGLSRFGNLTLPAVLVCLGYIIAGSEVYSLSIELCVAVASLALIHSGLTIDNDLQDYRIDQANHVSTVITQGSATDRKRIGMIAAAMVVLGLLLTVLLPMATGMTLWVMAMLGVLYNRYFVSRPIGSIVCLAVLYGGLPVVLGYGLEPGADNWSQVLLLVAGIVCARSGVSILKDFKDWSGDKAQGKRTFLLRYGSRRTILMSNLLAIVGLAWVTIITGKLIDPSLLTFYGITMTAIVGYVIYVRFRLDGAQDRRVNRIFHLLLAVQILFDGGLCVWLVL